MEIREPLPQDGPAVGRMHLACWREACAALLPAEFWDTATEPRWGERWTENLTDPADGVVSRIAVRDGEVVGLASAGPSRPNATAGPPVRPQELWALYVRAAEYGSGLASRLLDAVLPSGPAGLWVLEANPRAIAFYAKHGFTADGARHLLGPDLGHQPEVRLVR